jgi:hypothetical protein
MNINDLLTKKINPRLICVIECYVDYSTEASTDPQKIIAFLKKNPISELIEKTADRLGYQLSHSGSFGGTNLEIEFDKSWPKRDEPQQACQYLLKIREEFKKVIDDYTRTLEVIGLGHNVTEVYVIPRLRSPDLGGGDVAWPEHVYAIAAGEMTLDQAMEETQD